MKSKYKFRREILYIFKKESKTENSTLKLIKFDSLYCAPKKCYPQVRIFDCLCLSDDTFLVRNFPMRVKTFGLHEMLIVKWILRTDEGCLFAYLCQNNDVSLISAISCLPSATNRTS